MGILQKSNILLFEKIVPNLRHKYNDVKREILNIKLLYFTDILSLYILNNKYNKIGKIIKTLSNIISLNMVISIFVELCRILSKKITFLCYFNSSIYFFIFLAS